MKIVTLILYGLILFCLPCFGQEDKVVHTTISKSVLTIAHFQPSGCGYVNSKNSYRNSNADKNLLEVFDLLDAYDLGTGFVYEYKGEKYVITCEHVIFNSDSIVGYDQAYNAFPLELVGGDTFYDLAILKFKNPKDKKAWKGVELDIEPQSEAKVQAIGFWKINGNLNVGSGNLLNTNTTIIDRKLPIVKIGFLKSDAPTFGGFSGGPLFNSEGHVVGMNTMVHTQDNNSFALSSGILKRMIHSILNQDKVKKERLFLGMQFSQNFEGNKVKIDNVLEGTPAAPYHDLLEGKQLLMMNDVVIKEIYDVLKFMEVIEHSQDPITVEVGDANLTHQVEIYPEILSAKHHEAIALDAVRENDKDQCGGIELKNGTVYIHTSDQNLEMAMTAGLNDDRVYCINNLAQLGAIVRIFSLHGELRIGIDDAFNKGRWIWFSENDDRRVLYY